EVVLIEKQFRFVVRVITAVIAAQHIIPVPTRQRLNLVEAITQHLQRLSIKHLLVQIRIASLYIVFVDYPVEAPHTDILLDAGAGEHDVVAGIGVVVSIARATVEYIMTDDRTLEEDVAVITSDIVEAATPFDPVVTRASEQGVDAVTALDEVVARACEHFSAIGTGHDEITAIITHDQVEAIAAVDHVVTGAALDD